MRRKVYTRDYILKSAYQLVEKEGFGNFTARNVAKKMGVSTQPIYLEFENMQDLKDTLIDEIFTELKQKVFAQEHTGNKLVDVCINYIDFSQKKPKLFISLFIDESGGGKKMYDVSYQYFKEVVKEDPTYKDLPADFIEALHDGTWITITGVASLMASGFITPNRQQIVEIIQHSIDGILEINKQKTNS